MATARETICPGCGLRMPVSERVAYHGYYHASRECWGVYTEVLEREYGNAVLFGQVHQLTVDTYAVQHAGGPHPDKSVAVHLVGLHLVLEMGQDPPAVPRILQRLVSAVPARCPARWEWPHFAPPSEKSAITVCDVALSDAPLAHARTVREWARSVWSAWSPQHAAVASFAERFLARTRPRP